MRVPREPTPTPCLRAVRWGEATYMMLAGPNVMQVIVRKWPVLLAPVELLVHLEVVKPYGALGWRSRLQTGGPGCLLTTFMIAEMACIVQRLELFDGEVGHLHTRGVLVYGRAPSGRLSLSCDSDWFYLAPGCYSNEPLRVTESTRRLRV